jgi:MFS family permease
MLLGAEIAMLCVGLYALLTGKLALRNKTPVTGRRARIIGVILSMPVPIAFILGIPLGIILGVAGYKPRQPRDPALYWYGVGLEVCCLVVCLVIASILQRKYQKQIQTKSEDEDINVMPASDSERTAE